jgi:hypothetical protein
MYNAVYPLFWVKNTLFTVVGTTDDGNSKEYKGTERVNISNTFDKTNQNCCLEIRIIFVHF